MRGRGFILVEVCWGRRCLMMLCGFVGLKVEVECFD